jgi:tRNA(Ile)-lysidine synthase
VTAHTLDDQVETILMRLLSGSTRLTMHESTDMNVLGGWIRVVRPLLDVPRVDVLRVLSIAGVEPILDPSNEDTSFRRNAVRHEIVPAIASVFPGYERALLRSVTLREQDADYLNEAAASAFQELAVRERNGSLHLPRNLGKRVHLAVALRVLRMAAQDLIREPDDRELTFERIQAVYGALDGRTGSVIQLPYGIRVSVESQTLLFFRAEEGNEDG